MLVPLSWLKKYVKIDLSVEEFVRRMIMSGTAVEGYEDCGAEISNVVVGKLVEIAKHPNSDHLNICQVDVGGETPIQIVTGADNMSVGDLVPVALHDSHLPGGVHITRGKLRGEVSNGMMCSGEELGVPAEVYPSNVEHGLLILKGDLKPGQDIKPVLGLDDTVIDFDILANRPDCLSVLGLAHEASVAAGHPVVEPNYEYTTCGGDINELVKVRVDDPDLCTRYCAAVVKDIKIEPSPLWMREALHKAGVRPINNIVDITNYVMLEMGQPMHAFDLNSVRGRQIIVRRAKPDETMMTLDSKDRKLTENMLVIADAEGATGLAGIMGGENSEITDKTELVLFESACFDGANIRISGRSLGMRTEAQGRFERGVNVRLCKKALQRALIQYRNPANRDLVREALRKAHREDLIGFGPKCLVRPGDGRSGGPGGGKGGKGGKGAKGAHGAGISGNGARGGNGGKGATSGRGSKAGATKHGGKGGLSKGRGEHVGTHRPNAGNGSKRPRR